MPRLAVVLRRRLYLTLLDSADWRAGRYRLIHAAQQLVAWIHSRHDQHPLAAFVSESELQVNAFGSSLAQTQDPGLLFVHVDGVKRDHCAFLRFDDHLSLGEQSGDQAAVGIGDGDEYRNLTRYRIGLRTDAIDGPQERLRISTNLEPDPVA